MLLLKSTAKETDRADAGGFAYDTVYTLFACADQADIAPASVPHWIAGCEYLRRFWSMEELQLYASEEAHAA